MNNKAEQQHKSSESVYSQLIQNLRNKLGWLHLGRHPQRQARDSRSN